MVVKPMEVSHNLAVLDSGRERRTVAQMAVDDLLAFQGALQLQAMSDSDGWCRGSHKRRMEYFS